MDLGEVITVRSAVSVCHIMILNYVDTHYLPTKESRGGRTDSPWLPRKGAIHK